MQGCFFISDWSDKIVKVNAVQVDNSIMGCATMAIQAASKEIQPKYRQKVTQKLSFYLLSL